MCSRPVPTLDFWKKSAKKKSLLLILCWIVYDLSSADRTGQRPQTNNFSFLVSLKGHVASSILKKHSKVAVVCKPSVAAGVTLVCTFSQWFCDHKFNERQSALNILATWKQRSQSITDTLLGHSLLICRGCLPSVRVLAVSFPNDSHPAVQGRP